MKEKISLIYFPFQNPATPCTADFPRYKEKSYRRITFFVLKIRPRNMYFEHVIKSKEGFRYTGMTEDLE
jgi:hypothetical protein